MSRADYRDKAILAWGERLPAEIRELADYADRHGGARAAALIGYSQAVISQVIAAKYPGDLEGVLGRIRGALMGETVGCPVLGEIGRDRCLTEQARPFSTTSSVRARLYRACRSACPHSRLKGL